MEDKPDTRPAFAALSEAIGGSYRHLAEVYGAGVGRVWSALNDLEKEPPSLTSLAIYANRAWKKTGWRLTFWVVPGEQDIHYHLTLTGSDNQDDDNDADIQRNPFPSTSAAGQGRN